MADYIGAIDQGTTSTRFIVFDRDGQHRRRRPARARADHPAGRAGSSTTRARSGAHPRGDRRRAGQLPASRPATSRRSASPTSARRPCVWDRETRRAGPQRDRLAGHAHRRARARAGGDGRTGCARSPACRSRPTSPGPKITLDPRQRRRRARARRGGRARLRHDRHLGALEPHRRPDGGVHVTDVTNASRTLLMDLRDARLARAEPRPDGHPARDAAGDPLLQRGLRRGAPAPRSAATPVAGILGDQQAALFGQTCFDAGRRPRTPTAPAASCSSTPARRSCARDELLTTRRLQARRRPRRPTSLEGSIAVTGALVQWLRDRLGDHRPAPRGRGAGARPSTTTAASTSCPPSPACSPRTGATTRAA